MVAARDIASGPGLDAVLRRVDRLDRLDRLGCGGSGGRPVLSTASALSAGARGPDPTVSGPVGSGAGAGPAQRWPQGRGLRPPLLPVPAPLLPLLPEGGLRRGSVLVVGGSPTLLLSLLATATGQGFWAAVVGMPGLGLVAADEAGVALRRLALVPRPGSELAATAAALLDGLDLVVVAGATGLPAGARRNLAARARQRGTVLLPLGHWPGADLRLSCHDAEWAGAEHGYGRLRSRAVTVRAHGRGAAARPQEVRLLLPGPEGAVSPLPVAGPAAASAAEPASAMSSGASSGMSSEMSAVG